MKLAPFLSLEDSACSRHICKLLQEVSMYVCCVCVDLSLWYIVCCFISTFSFVFAVSIPEIFSIECQDASIKGILVLQNILYN